MNAVIYATALYRVLQGKNAEETDRIIMRFVALIRNRGHGRLFPAILRKLKEMEERIEARTATITTVSLSSTERELEGLEHDLAELGVKRSDAMHRIDTTLIGGYIVESCGKRIDQSYKRTLIHMYHALAGHH